MRPLVGQIMLFGGNFAPRGWAFCDGQLLDIDEHPSLFAILGVTYGGDGRKKFALPDLRGRVPMHAGHGTGLRPRSIGQKTGTETITQGLRAIPQHQQASPPPTCSCQTTDIALDTKAPAVTDLVGLDIAHGNMQPSLCINYIIAFEGLFPSRN
ncbi:phage tail protein [Loktanella agnita]|uniref:phage tail protein n=1 Tax=Loktanella agnita TaxID=287097 RepID=UPI0039867668